MVDHSNDHRPNQETIQLYSIYFTGILSPGHIRILSSTVVLIIEEILYDAIAAGNAEEIDPPPGGE